jgi:hypothetical protein
MLRADEMALREALVREIAEGLQKENFALLEQRYAQAVASKARMPSGVFVSNRFLRSVSIAAAKQPATLVAGHEVDIRKIADGVSTGLDEKAARWVKDFPNSSLAAVVQSQFLIEHGYVFRGFGNASRVSAEDMKVFDDYVQRAYVALNTKRAVGKADPGWYYQMLRIARLQGWTPDRFTELLKQALEAAPYYYDIYFEAAEFLLPRWGGSVETLESFADFSVKNTQSNEGFSLYARIYWNLSGYYGNNLFQATRVDWKKMRAGFDDVVKRYPDSWNLNSFALFACQAGDRSTTKSLLARIDSNVEPTVWESRQLFNRCRLWANETSGGKQERP